MIDFLCITHRNLGFEVRAGEWGCSQKQRCSGNEQRQKLSDVAENLEKLLQDCSRTPVALLREYGGVMVVVGHISLVLVGEVAVLQIYRYVKLN